MDNQINKTPSNKAGIVLACGVLLKLSLGVLYSWSLIQARMIAPAADGGFGWTVSQAGLPYVIAIVVCSFAMLLGGRTQDKIGPRWVLTSGALLKGSGLLLAGFVGDNFAGVVFSFSILAGVGMGLLYSSVAAPALKWFHPSKKGLISGIIVGAFGLSSMFFAPLTSALLDNFGISRTFTILGIITLALPTLLAQFINNPPAGYVPAAPLKIKQGAKTRAPAADFAWREMLKTKRFRFAFIIFLMTASVGLMFIGNMVNVAQLQAGISDGAALAGIVSFLALTNALGRVIGGRASDKIGRVNTIYLILIVQMLNMAAFSFYQSLPALLVGVFFVGLCFGALLAVMPALCADMYGLKNFGLNYAIMFFAWGFAGVFAPITANILYDATGSFNIAYIICCAMMAAMVSVNFFLKKDIDASLVLPPAKNSQ